MEYRILGKSRAENFQTWIWRNPPFREFDAEGTKKLLHEW